MRRNTQGMVWNVYYDLGEGVTEMVWGLGSSLLSCMPVPAFRQPEQYDVTSRVPY